MSGWMVSWGLALVLTVACDAAGERGRSAMSESEREAMVERYRLNPIPAALGARRGAHPRLYLDADRVAALRKAIQTTHAALWEKARAQADRAAENGPPAYQEDDRWSGQEQLYQRNVGNAMPLLAMVYLMTGERRYLEAARAWALASCGYRTWGLGRIDGLDLAAGHQLFGLGIVYDWLHRDLDEEARRTIRETLVRRGQAMFEAAAAERIWWHRSYLQNHLWVNICGLCVAGLALFDEVEGASAWVGLPLDKFRRTMEALGPDGASHEGAGYWGYGVEYLLKFMHLARELLGVDLYDHLWWRNTASYRLYLALPRRAWTRQNNVVDIADCPRSNWYGPDYLLRGLAREFRDGHAQWLAGEIDGAGVENGEARWLNLVWFDPSLEARPPEDLPTLRHYDDMEIVSARSDWSGGESLVVFKCGPYIGHHAVQAFDYDPGGGHVHPDANHFVLFGGGEWLIRDDGYRAKDTAQHNTLLIHGRGQIGEGKMWFSGGDLLKLRARPRILRAVSTPGLDQIAGDATEAYPREVGLRRFVRHLLFLKPDVLIVADEVELSAARPLELRFHPERRAEQGADGAYLARGERAVLRLEALTTEGVEVSAADLPVRGRHGEEGDERMFTIRLRTERAIWRNAVALSWSAAGAEPARVRLQQKGEVWAFTGGGRTVALDWGTGEARLK